MRKTNKNWKLPTNKTCCNQSFLIMVDFCGTHNMEIVEYFCNKRYSCNSRLLLLNMHKEAPFFCPSWSNWENTKISVEMQNSYKLVQILLDEK
jgi:hypothetical protein